MEPWSLARYQRPFLDVDAVEVSLTTNMVTLRAREISRAVQCDSAVVAAELAAGLNSLRDPADPLWASIRIGEDAQGWGELLQHVDDWTLIRDCGAPHIAGLDEVREIRDSVAEAVADIRRRVGPERQVELKRIAAHVLDSLDACDVIEAWSHPNFYVGVLGLMARAARDRAPETHLALREALTALVADRPPDMCVDPNISRGLYGTEDLRIRLTAAVNFLVASLEPDAQRRWIAPPKVKATISGIDFAVTAERALRAGLAQVGSERFIRSLVGQTAHSPVVVGCYVEEYHVTRRFVEMITPLMAKSLSPRLRALVFRYYAEEVGHEAFERATCRSLGVDPILLDRSYPLPLHVAFVDLFTQLAVDDPLGFFAAVSITEGLLGDTSPLPQLLSKIADEQTEFRSVYRNHDELNNTLNHAAICRIALQEVTAVPPAAQYKSLSSLTFLLELNARAWEGVTAYYGPQSEFEHHGWLSRPAPAKRKAG